VAASLKELRDAIDVEAQIEPQRNIDFWTTPRSLLPLSSAAYLTVMLKVDPPGQKETPFSPRGKTFSGLASSL
jgi:hypothetical protein